MIRETSCFEDFCYDAGGLFHPSCPGWLYSKVKVFEAIDGSDMHNGPVVVAEDVMPAVVVQAGIPDVVPAVVPPVIPVVVITTPAEAVAIPDFVETNDVPAVCITPALTTPDDLATNTMVVTPEVTAKAKETGVEPAPVTLEKQPRSGSSFGSRRLRYSCIWEAMVCGSGNGYIRRR